MLKGKENLPNNNHSHEHRQSVDRIPVVNLNNMARNHEQNSNWHEAGENTQKEKDNDLQHETVVVVIWLL